MKNVSFARCFFLMVSVLVWQIVNADISVAFPAENQKLPAVTNTYVIGAVDAKAMTTLFVNGQEVAVHRTGAFITMAMVKPGKNQLTFVRGRDKLVRTFTVAEPSDAEVKKFKPVEDEGDERIGSIGAWKLTGSLFMNRVRKEPNDGDTLFYLPKDFVVRGAEFDGGKSVIVWIEGRYGFVSKKYIEKISGVKVPSASLAAPDVAIGFSNKPPYGKHPENVTICVDPGHGGKESGALSPHGWKEKDVNLMQARAIRDALEKAGFHVEMTRDGDSTYSLMDRPKFAYDIKADAFISVHHNATAAHRDPRKVRHTTTYASTESGFELAKAIQKHIGEVMEPVKDSGAQMKSLAVCRNPAVPSCLLEVDFINLPEGEEESWNTQRQKKVANAVVLGVLDWMMTPPQNSEDKSKN